MKHFCLSTFLLISLLYTQNIKAETVANGTCGDDCTWSIEDGVLNITGTGNMTDYQRPCDGGCHSTAPWWQYSSSIQKVSIDEGISSIGYGAFANMRFTEIDLPQTLQKISALAFIGSNLRTIDIPDTVNQIGSLAFDDNHIEELRIPTSLTKLESGAFASNPIHTLVIPEGVTQISPTAFYCQGCSSTQAGRALPLESIYCSTAQMEQCRAVASYFGEDVKIVEYESIGNSIYVNGKFYQNANDILTGNYIKKRIYTIPKAERLSKSTGNKFKIRYQ